MPSYHCLKVASETSITSLIPTNRLHQTRQDHLEEKIIMIPNPKNFAALRVLEVSGVLDSPDSPFGIAARKMSPSPRVVPGLFAVESSVRQVTSESDRPLQLCFPDFLHTEPHFPSSLLGHYRQASCRRNRGSIVWSSRRIGAQRRHVPCLYTCSSNLRHKRLPCQAQRLLAQNNLDPRDRACKCKHHRNSTRYLSTRSGI